MRPSLLIAAAIAFCVHSAGRAEETLQPISFAEAMTVLPDHTRYRIVLTPSDEPGGDLQTLTRIIADAARSQHFYGAIYGYRPAKGGATTYSMRSQLHSREAARQGASADCEAAREQADGDCRLIGEILPEDWSDRTPELSHVAVEALRQTSGQLPGEVVVTASQNGDAFEIQAGDGVRDAALRDCNTRNAEAGLPQDCRVIVLDEGRD